MPLGFNVVIVVHCECDHVERKWTLLAERKHRPSCSAASSQVDLTCRCKWIAVNSVALNKALICTGGGGCRRGGAETAAGPKPRRPSDGINTSRLPCVPPPILCTAARRPASGLPEKVTEDLTWSSRWGGVTVQRGGGRGIRCVSTEPACRNPWQQLLLSHLLALGGRMLVILAETVSPWQALVVKPVPLACFEGPGDYERSAFCSVVFRHI